jgi:hypothetical protein
VREIRDGLILSSNLDETPWVIDVKDPAKPKVLAQGDGPKGWAGERGYLWHSGRWPREGQDRWVLMGGEDVLNPPKRTTCQEDQGPFATFDSTGWQKTHKLTVVDFFRVDDGIYADGNPPANAFGCSGHWFEEHSTFNNGGLVVMAWYDHGTRFLEVKPTGKIEQVGYFLPYAGESSSTYWANDEIVYVADYSRGLDILRWTGKTYVPAATGGGGGSGGGGGGGGGGTSQLPRGAQTLQGQQGHDGEAATEGQRRLQAAGDQEPQAQLRGEIHRRGGLQTS